MKKVLFILAAILLGIILYIWQDPQLGKKVKDQTRDLISPETTTVYKWQDANGQWQVSNQPPPGDIPYETLEYHRDTNVVPADKAGKARK
ncbi:MAG: DUF4124 domain-containing protein [Thioalkalispiraceae bacterium]|jgi:hypothetical protein